MEKYVTIPPEEFGPGSKLDFVNNRLIGVSGTVYENVRFSADDIYRAFSFGKSREEFDAFVKGMQRPH